MTFPWNIKRAMGPASRWTALLGMVFCVAVYPSSLERDVPSAPEEGIPEPVYKIARPAVPPDLPNGKGEPETAYQAIIQEASTKYGVDPALVKAVIMAESSYDPGAVSKKGALGLMQLMPSTAEALGVEEPLDPAHNIHGGVRYLKQLLNHFDGDLPLAVAAYNAGLTKVRHYRGIPPFKATQYYVRRVVQYYHYYRQKREGTKSTV